MFKVNYKNLLANKGFKLIFIRKNVYLLSFYLFNFEDKFIPLNHLEKKYDFFERI